MKWVYFVITADIIADLAGRVKINPPNTRFRQHHASEATQVDRTVASPGCIVCIVAFQFVTSKYARKMSFCVKISKLLTKLVTSKYLFVKLSFFTNNQYRTLNETEIRGITPEHSPASTLKCVYCSFCLYVLFVCTCDDVVTQRTDTIQPVAVMSAVVGLSQVISELFRLLRPCSNRDDTPLNELVQFLPRYRSPRLRRIRCLLWWICSSLRRISCLLRSIHWSFGLVHFSFCFRL